jgi:hypothetical protein
MIYIRRGPGTVHVLSRFGDRTVCGKLVDDVAKDGKLLKGGSHPWRQVGTAGVKSGAVRHLCKNCDRMKGAGTA